MTPADSIAELCEPTAAPDPVAEERIDEAADDNAEDKEALEAPALGTRTGDNGCRGVHEDHHEEEENDGRSVVAASSQEEARRTEQSPTVVTVDRRANGEHVIERRNATEAGRTTNRRTIHTAAHEREAAREKAKHAECVHQKVHGERVGRILRANEASFDEREAGLHEHNEEPGYQRPHEIDGEDAVRCRLRNRIDRNREILGCRLFRIRLHVTWNGQCSWRILECTGPVGCWLISTDSTARESRRHECDDQREPNESMFLLSWR